METVKGKIKRIYYSDASLFIDSLFEKKLAESFDFQVGGVFSAKKIKKWISKKNTSGIMFWFGIEEGSQKPVLSFERKKENFRFSEADLQNYRPNQPWSHLRGLRKIKDIEDVSFLNNPPIGETRQSVIEQHLKKGNFNSVSGFRRRDSSNVMSMCEGFKYHLVSKGESSVGFTFFSFSEDVGLEINGVLKKHWTWFFDQGDVHFIRYYLGYNINKRDHPICLILLPVNKEGKNFSKDDLVKGMDKTLEEEPVLLEYSWPPRNP